MTGPWRRVTKLPWTIAALTLSLCLASARAEPPPKTRELAKKESLDQWRRKSARRALATYDGQSLAVGQDGSLWVWGQGPGSWVGTWPEIEVASGTPRRVPGIQGVVSVAVATDLWRSPGLALMADGTVQAWGQNNSMGQLGDGTTLPRETRVTVQGLDQVVAISAGAAFALAVRADGTVWGWGGNGCGNLGDGTQVNRPSPVQVVGLTDVVAVAAGGGYSLALRTDGTVWAWGSNSYGQLGDMTLQSRSTAVQVQGLANVVAVFAGEDLSLALRRDGSVWWWGSTRSAWRRGDRRPHAPEPVQGLTNIVKLSAADGAVYAVRADGTVWKWTVGVPGEVNPAQQVEGFTNAVDVAVSSSATFIPLGSTQTHSTLHVLRADGTVWTDGNNLLGERGIPSLAIAPPGPSQVAGLTGVVSVAANEFHAHALRADGTLVGWGENLLGLIGDGIPPYHPTPVRVPTPCRLIGQPTCEASSGQP